MATQWDTIAIPFQGGIDTKSDAKSAPPTRMVELENGVFTKRGSIRKRHGYDLTEITDGVSLSTLNDSLVVIGEDTASTYHEGSDSLLTQGYMNRVSLSTKEVESAPLVRTMGDQAENNSVGVRAWMNSSNEIELSIYDARTGAVILELSGGTLATGNRPRCLRVGIFLHVVYAVGGSTDLMSLPINTTKPADTLVADAVVIASDMEATEVFDAVELPGAANAVFVYTSTATENVRWGRLFQSGSSDVKTGITQANDPTALSISASSENAVIGYVSSATFGAFGLDDVQANMVYQGGSSEEAVAGYDAVSTATTETK
ncbi:MAG: hypothetical protein KAJ19_18090, partial [Gammaproteobacteria bacterium]|nr:hypothetical protein [Gammaproteobacteria bacterium]